MALFCLILDVIISTPPSERQHAKNRDKEKQHRARSLSLWKRKKMMSDVEESVGTWVLTLCYSLLYVQPKWEAFI